MSVDYAALLGLGAGIQVAKGDYSFARDGGALGTHNGNWQLLPAGAIIIGWALLTTVGFTFNTTGVMVLSLGARTIATPVSTLDYALIAWSALAPAELTLGAQTPTWYITNDIVTAGECTAWLFYLIV